MRSIVLDKIKKSHGKSPTLNNVNLSIPSGKFFALLGPSGCGKTTLLRLIAGFESLDSGAIYLGDLNITNIPANERKINIVFQNYALFPHLTVFDNIAYSLHIQKRPKEEVEQRVKKLLSAFALETQIYKYPSELSGGQQQRVALARAIINEPEVLLLDEPLAALDFKLREKMLVELIDLQNKLKTTFIYVTHDQFEALTVADSMAIMNHDGDIEQIGTPEQIYEFPVSSFVAEFVGTTNLLSGTLDCKGDPAIQINGLGEFKVHLANKKEWMHHGCAVSMSLRPEKIFISKKLEEGFSNVVKGIVKQIVYYGRSTQYHVQIDDQYTLQVFEQNEEHFPQEEIDYENEVFLFWQKENVVLFKE